MLMCPNCKRLIEADWRLCPACETPIPTAMGDSLRIRSPEAHATVNPTFVLPGAPAGATPQTRVKCPECGRKPLEADTFDCVGPCGRVNLCLEHQDKERRVCANCAALFRGDAEKEAARWAQVQAERDMWRARAENAERELADIRRNEQAALQVEAARLAAERARSARNAPAAEEARKRGERHGKEGRYDQAIEEFSAAIELNPQNAEYWLLRGEFYTRKSDYQRGISDFSRAVELDPSLDKAWGWHASSYRVMGNYDRAIADYGRAIEVSPEVVDWWAQRARCYEERGQYDRAIADYTRAIELNPNRGDCWFGRSKCYKALGDMKRAAVDGARALEFGYY